MELLAGIDLHSDNGYLGIADIQGKRVYDKKLPNKLPEVLSALGPYRDRLKGVVIESTYNWYWLVDGLMDHGYPVILANPAGMEPYSGLSGRKSGPIRSWRRRPWLISYARRVILS